jgi:hypothetical protein
MIPSLGTKLRYSAMFYDIVRCGPKFENAMSLDNGLLTAGCMSFFT